MKIAIMKNISIAKYQPSEPELAEYIVEECTHEKRNLQLPIRRDEVIEECSYCKEITRKL